MTARDVPEATLTIDVPGLPGTPGWRLRAQQRATLALVGAGLHGPLAPTYSLTAALFGPPFGLNVLPVLDDLLQALVAGGVIPGDFDRHRDFRRVEAVANGIRAGLPADAPGGNEPRTLIYLRTHAQELNW